MTLNYVEKSVMVQRNQFQNIIIPQAHKAL